MKSAGGGAPGACFKCGEAGHMSRECPQGGGGGGGEADFDVEIEPHIQVLFPVSNVARPATCPVNVHKEASLTR